LGFLNVTRPPFGGWPDRILRVFFLMPAPALFRSFCRFPLFVSACFVLMSGLTGRVLAQPSPTDSLPAHAERDLFDLLERAFPRLRFSSHTPQALEQGQTLLVVLPLPGYAPQTRLSAQLAANAAYRRPRANVSAGVLSLTYTQNRQLILLGQLQHWTADNRWLWTFDGRLMRYPQNTYGLGTRTGPADEIRMEYDYLRLYPTVYRRIARDFYAGLGYGLDLRWGIRSSTDAGDLRAISGYPFGVQGRSVATGPRLGVVFDNRSNALNPERGLYANALLRADTRALGSDRTHQMLLLDLRAYLPTPGRDNTLAFWSYSTFTLGGAPPYLDLPSTAWDTQSASGRGYVQGRFRGRHLLYAETEYRFPLRRDRLLGGVVFANAQTFAEPTTNRFAAVAPAAGLGLRVRVNKFSRVNLAIDYGVGLNGSRGLYFNLGEVF
jgi:hypothetical protein